MRKLVIAIGLVATVLTVTAAAKPPSTVIATSETGWRRHSVDGRTVRVQPGGARHA